MESDLLAIRLLSQGKQLKEATVELSNELVPLLSEQLYRSPMKAIEELVVNSYDAAAKECRLFVPTPSAQLAETDPFMVVFDDGDGMEVEGLVDLWVVGRSPKRIGDRVYKNRKQIGKFGIGKIASYSVANRLTYVTKHDGGDILTSTLNFKDLVGGNSSEVKRVPVPITKLDSLDNLLENDRFLFAIKAAHVAQTELKNKSWTFVILEDLKPSAADLKLGRLNWVLRTAMPIRTEFSLFLNGEQLTSSKYNFEPLIQFNVSELQDHYIQGLNDEFQSDWRASETKLVSNTFPTGVTGTVQVMERSLIGKSDDLERSNGFFVRVRDRLVNQTDPLFGTTPLSHQVFSRFIADVNADDLDVAVKAGREDIETSSLRAEFVGVLRALYNDARTRYNDVIRKKDESERGKIEDNREYVPHSLVERPMADVLATDGTFEDGSDADRHWFYLEFPDDADVNTLIERLYTEPRSGFDFQYIGKSSSSHFVKLDPTTNTFTFNTNHEFVRKHNDNRAGTSCLEDIAITETLLEVYLRDEGVLPSKVGEILQRRDKLFRSLARDNLQSSQAIAGFLRDSANNNTDLEIALVIAARALGFVATHISNSDKPDGIARLTDYPRGDLTIILEAKSGKEKDHSEISFSTLKEHMDEAHGANGCMLVVPSYSGQAQDPEKNAIANQARDAQISCWTIDQLAKVVERIEERHITAKQIFEIVTNSFAPVDVAKSIESLLGEPTWDRSALYLAILEAMKHLEGQLKRSPRSVDMIATQIINSGKAFTELEANDVKIALAQLAGASQGSITLGDDGERVYIHSSLEELSHRVASLTGHAGKDRKPGKFRKNNI